MSEHSSSIKHFTMVDVGEKKATRRRAVAEGSIYVGEEAFRLIEENKLPKGNVLALAEAAGLSAAKKTSETIPLCHPLTLDQVGVRFRLVAEQSTVTVFCEASALAKTGVEMEALSGVNAALLCIYDLAKAVTPALTISTIRLRVKEGGKSGRWLHPDLGESESEPEDEQGDEVSAPGESLSLEAIRAAVIVISDRVSAGTADDRSGPCIEQFLRKEGAQVVDFVQLADDKEQIKSAVNRLAFQEKVPLVLTTGGTGLGPRDVTPEAISELSDRYIPGIGELIRYSGLKHTPYSVLSRSVAALVGETLLISLPGSPKAVAESLRGMEKIIAHALKMIAGGNHEQ